MGHIDYSLNYITIYKKIHINFLDSTKKRRVLSSGGSVCNEQSRLVFVRCQGLKAMVLYCVNENQEAKVFILYYEKGKNEFEYLFQKDKLSYKMMHQSGGKCTWLLFGRSLVPRNHCCLGLIPSTSSSNGREAFWLEGILADKIQYRALEDPYTSSSGYFKSGQK